MAEPKQGVLWKKGKWTRKWMKRWVSVTGDHIIYYGCEKDRSEGTHQPKGTIDIAGCVIRTQDTRLSGMITRLAPSSATGR